MTCSYQGQEIFMQLVKEDGENWPSNPTPRGCPPPPRPRTQEHIPQELSAAHGFFERLGDLSNMESGCPSSHSSTFPVTEHRVFRHRQKLDYKQK